MILVATDHATFLKYPDSERGRRFIERLTAVGQAEVVGVAIVTIEERMRGWLATIAKERRSGKWPAIGNWPSCSSSTRSLRSSPSMTLPPGNSTTSASNVFTWAPWI